MKQHEAVIEAMKRNGGYATLGYLYQNAINVPGVEWKTKTPFASIRRIVQDSRFFYKIKPGLWALKEFRNKLPKALTPRKTTKTKNSLFNHSYYQGLIVQIGNLKGYDTYIPPQDKNKIFLKKPLSSVSKLTKIYDFSYPNILRKAKTVDVIWFNDRKLPSSFFEVEHSTNIANSLSKFYELQDYNSKFFIVSSTARKREFDDKIESRIFRDIKSRVSFVDYDFIANYHSRTFEMSLLSSKVSL